MQLMDAGAGAGVGGGVAAVRGGVGWVGVSSCFLEKSCIPGISAGPFRGLLPLSPSTQVHFSIVTLDSKMHVQDATY